MLTKIEELREEQGISTARSVFDMTDEAEAVHYVRELFKTQLKRAETDAQGIIRYIEISHEKGFKKNAIGLYRNRTAIMGLLKQYGVLTILRGHAANIVQAHFAAREQCAGMDTKKWFNPEELGD